MTAELLRRAAGMRVPGVASLGSAVGCVVYLVVEPVDAVVFWALMVIAFWLALLAARSLYGPVNLTEPIHWINATYLVLFGLHPIGLYVEGTLHSPYHGKFDIASTYPEAIGVGLVSMVAVNAAYAVVSQVRRPRPRPVAGLPAPSRTPTPTPVPTVRHVRRLRNGAWTLTIVGAIGLRILLSIAGNNVNGSSAEGSTAYAYNLPYVLVPAALLFLIVYWYERKITDLLVGSLVSLGYATILVTIGARTPLVLAIGAPALFLVLQWGRSINRLGVLLIAVAVVFTFSALRDANSPGSSLGRSLAQSVAHPSTLLTSTFTQDDTEMVDALSLELQVVPEVVPYQPAIVVRSTLGAPVPRLIWPGKPKTADVILNELFFHRGANEASVAYSMLGEQYLDSGLTGVVGYGAALGAVYGYLWRRRRRRSPSPVGTALLATSTALIPIVVRGILAYELAIAAFLLVPLVLAIFWARLSPRQPGLDGDRRARGQDEVPITGGSRWAEAS